MNIKRLKRLFAVGLALSLLTGCTLTERLDTGDKGAVSTPVVTEHDAGYLGLAYYTGEAVNPIFTTSRINRVLVEALYEGLFYLDNSFQPRPMLCETWQGDGWTFTFQLKENVKFWSGNILSADDVVYSLKAAIANEASPYHVRTGDIKAVYAVDAYTVGIELYTPNQDFPRLLDIPVFRLGTEGDTFSDGTGAYQPRQEDGAAWLAPFADWHGGAAGVFERMDLISTARSEAAISSFDTGDVSLLRAERISANPVMLTGAVDLHQTPTTNLHYLGFATQVGPTSLPLVRQAISAAIGRKGICDTQLQTFADAAVLPVNPQPAAPSVSVKADRDTAVALLAQADFIDTTGDGIIDYDNGLTNRIAFTPSILVNSENTFKVAAAQQIAESLALVGIPAVVDAVPFEEYNARLANGRFDLYYGEVRMMPDFDLRQLICTGGTLNFSGYTDQGTDWLVQLMREQGTDEARQNLYAQLLQEMPIAPIAFVRDQIAVRSGVIEGFSPSTGWIFHGVTGWRKG